MSNAKKGEIDEAPAAESENMESEGLKEGVSSDDDSSPNSLAKIKSAEEDVENEGEGASSELDADEEPVEEPSTPDVANDLDSVCILFVEDDEDTAKLVTESMKAIGVKDVVRVATAATAYFQLTNDEELFPDLILLELVLPGMSGIQFLAKLRSDPDLRIRTLPVVVLTEVDSASVYQRVTNQNISAYLRKPVASGGLRTAITAALSGKVIEPPLAFGRSWIDDAEDEEDSRSDEESGSSWISRLFAGLFGGKKKRRRR